MQRSNRRVRFGRWFLLLWAVAVLAMILAGTFKSEPEPLYDGATFVRMEMGWLYA